MPDIIRKRTKVAGIVLTHCISAIIFTLVSKLSLKATQSPFPLLAVQISIQSLLFGFSAWLSGKDLMNVADYKRLFPLAITRLIGIVAKTTCLSLVDATFYQVARGLLLPFSVLLSFFLLKRSTSFTLGSLLSIACVCAGFGYGFLTEYLTLKSSVIGLFFGVFSSLVTALESVVVKLYFLDGDQDALLTASITSTLQMLLMAPLATIKKDGLASIEDMLSGKLFFYGALSGLSYALVVYAAFLQIAITSPITHTMVAAARGSIQSLLASIFFKEVLSSSRIISMAFVTCGTAMYTLVKDREHQRAEIPEAIRRNEPDEESAPLVEKDDL